MEPFGLGLRHNVVVVFRGAVLLLVVGLLSSCASEQPDRDSSAGAAADCLDGIFTSGRWLEREDSNDWVLEPSELGRAVGAIGTSGCDDGGGEVTRGSGELEASWLPLGTEVFEVDGYSASERVAVIVDGRTLVYGQVGAPARLSPELVNHIEILSEFDGATVIASISDSSTVERLVVEYNQADPRPHRDWEPISRYFIAFVTTDRLATTAAFDLTSNTFADGRRMDATWARAVTDALDAAPEQIFDGFTLRTDRGQASFHATGTCRRDRPDLRIKPDETLELQNTTGSEIVYISASDDEHNTYALEKTEQITLRPFRHNVLIELELIADDGTTATICTVLAR